MTRMTQTKFSMMSISDQWEYVQTMQRQIDFLTQAIDDCINMAGSREDEWGDRAVSAFAYLHATRD